MTMGRRMLQAAGPGLVRRIALAALVCLALGAVGCAKPGGPQPADKAKDIYNLREVRQYFVKNETVGKLFVVTGEVVNASKETLENIKVEVTLYDAAGKKLTSKQQLCGNVVGANELQTFSQEDIEAALTDEHGVQMVNADVQPGQDVPFVVVFYNPPDTLKEINVKAVESKKAGKGK